MATACKWLHHFICGWKVHIQKGSNCFKGIFSSCSGSHPQMLAPDFSAQTNTVESLHVPATSMVMLLPCTDFIQVSHSEEKPSLQCQIKTWTCLRFINGFNHQNTSIVLGNKTGSQEVDYFLVFDLGFWEGLCDLGYFLSPENVATGMEMIRGMHVCAS